MSARTTPHLLAPNVELLNGDDDAGASFYETALPAEERVLYRQAHLERGLDGEIALLRLQLYQLLKNKPKRAEPAITQVTARLIDLLIKALRAHGAGDTSDRTLLDALLDEESARILDHSREN
ncbi:MAG: hypothetical protein JWO59_75 [Chloroflexi bacterium]|nr:hypothetical protein [Chloroflexota bacterium]